jgi:hypothetical protein
LAYAAGMKKACTDQSSATSAGRKPLPNGSNQAFGRRVTRPHNRGVGSPSVAATRARAYSRIARPMNRDAAM